MIQVFPNLKRLAVAAAMASMLFSSIVVADHLMITRHFTGIWDQPDHQSQGLVLQISEQANDQKIGVAYWFTYNENLESSWYLGAGPIDGHNIHMTLYRATGVAFMQDGIEGDPDVVPVGTLDLSFHNCNQGWAVFDTDEEIIGSGEFRIKRIASIYPLTLQRRYFGRHAL